MLKILLLCNDPVTLALMRASADALKGVLDAFDDAADLQRKLNKGTNGLPVAVVLDLAALAARGIRLANACTRVRQTLPDAKIGVIASATHWVDDVIVEWAREAGADYAVAQINPWRWNMTGERLLNELIGDRDRLHAELATELHVLLRRRASVGVEGVPVEVGLDVHQRPMGRV